MVQSIAAKAYDPAVLRGFGLVVVDEAHHICARMFSRAMRKLPAPRLGCWTCGEMWLHAAPVLRPPYAAVRSLFHPGRDHYREEFPRALWPPELLAPADSGGGDGGGELVGTGED